MVGAIPPEGHAGKTAELGNATSGNNAQRAAEGMGPAAVAGRP